MSFTSNLNPPKQCPNTAGQKASIYRVVVDANTKNLQKNVHPRAEWKIGEIQSNHLSKIPQFTAGKP